MNNVPSPALQILLLIITSIAAKLQHDPGTPPPTFGDPIKNITVIKGRDITFTCIVKHLGQYKVGWVKADTKAIQAIHHQVVTHNPRVSVTYRDRTTWNLHIRDVQEDDRGVYMCQVNTDPMIAERASQSQYLVNIATTENQTGVATRMMAYLEVVVPPQIVDEDSSGETEVDESSSVTLTCKANGHPTPKVSWQREGNAKIVLRDHGSKKVSTVEGEMLTLAKLKRQDMGPYLCIAKNGIPPSVSKRIMLRVNFKPEMEVPLHMVGAPLGDDVTISCRVEASPKGVNTWRKYPGEQMIISSSKYNVTEKQIGYYQTVMSLTVQNFTMLDATSYDCTSSNSLGYSESRIQIYEIPAVKIKKETNEISKDIDDVNYQTNEKETKDLTKTRNSKNNLDNNLYSYPAGTNKGTDQGRSRENSRKKNSNSPEESLYNARPETEDNDRGSLDFTFFSSGCQTKICSTIGIIFVVLANSIAFKTLSSSLLL